MNKLILSSIVIFTITGCVSTTPENLAPNDPRTCAQNFTHAGSLITGKSFKTNDIIANTDKKTAFTKISKFVAMDGWHILNSDHELGMINASQTVTFGEGATAPLNISVDQLNNSVKVSISFSTSIGVHSPAESVMESFCGMIASAK
jgi:hypothetical protein